MTNREIIEQATTFAKRNGCYDASKIEQIINDGIVPEGAQILLNRAQNVRLLHYASKAMTHAIWIAGLHAGEIAQKQPTDTELKQQITLACYAAHEAHKAAVA